MPLGLLTRSTTGLSFPEITVPSASTFWLGSTFWPMEAVIPSTFTFPASISLSASRREQKPDSLKNLFRRTPSVPLFISCFLLSTSAVLPCLFSFSIVFSAEGFSRNPVFCLRVLPLSCSLFPACVLAAPAKLLQASQNFLRLFYHPLAVLIFIPLIQVHKFRRIARPQL